MTEQPTIRDLIREKSLELRDMDKIGPERAAELGVELSSLLASLNAYIGEQEFWYNQLKLRKLTDNGNVVGKAKIHAEASAEWKSWNDARLQGKALELTLRSVNRYLRTAETEQKLT